MKKSLILILFFISFFCFSCENSKKNKNNINNHNNNNISVPLRNDCSTSITFPAANETSAVLVGDFNEWSIADGFPMERNGYTWEIGVTSNPQDSHAGYYILTPGEYGYKIVLNDNDWRMDEGNPYWVFDKTQNIANSLLILPDCSTPRVEEINTEVDWEQKVIRLHFQVYRPGDGSSITSVTHEARRGDTTVTASINYNAATGEGVITASNLSLGKYNFIIHVQTAEQAIQKRIPVWMEPRPLGWEDQILYAIFVDRFYNGDPTNDAPIPGIEQQINWQGGDWKGITVKLREGFFTNLGITALWLSTPMDNPDDPQPGDCGRMFSGYHAYWPQSSREPENHFGTVEDLKELVQEAHTRGIRVLVDWAANHIFIDHELHRRYYGNRFWFNYPGSTDPTEFWKNKCGYLGWNEYALTCWFTEYLPDYNHRNPELLKILINDALWWVDTFDLDGFRVDATKHIESNYLRLLRRALDENATGKTAPFYMVGENFLYDYAIINEKIGPYELQGQFDFPLYGAIRTALIGSESNLSLLNSFVYANFIDYQGITNLRWDMEGVTPHGTLMGNFLGNHDVERFSSVAAGQANGDGCQAFSQQVPQPNDPTVYQRMGVAFTFLLTVRGLPVIYYGDEFGLAGVKDPDNRRPMIFEDHLLSDAQRALKDLVARLNHARQTYAALRIGKYDAFYGENSCLAYVKAASQELPVLVVLAGHAGCSASIEIKPGYGLNDGMRLRDALYGHETSIANARISVNLSPFEVRLFIPTN